MSFTLPLHAAARAASSTTPSGAREHAETVIAWHGLARTGRDMDDIAAHLAQRYRVICPDTHRPRPEPVEPGAREREYCLAFYVAARARRWSTSSGSTRALARHLDGRRDRHARPRPARCAAASAGWC